MSRRDIESAAHPARLHDAIERQRARERTGELVGLAEQLGFPLYLGAGRIVRGWARVKSGEGEAGIAEMKRAMVEMARIGTLLAAPWALSCFAEGLRKVGRHDEALGAVGRGVGLAEQQGQHFYVAELHRLRAEILLETVDSQQSRVESEKTAEECFHQALEIARRQEAKWFELRAATSLARLWQRQGKRDAARALLGKSYEWFTEGFDTRDLIEAKALLEELG